MEKTRNNQLLQLNRAVYWGKELVDIDESPQWSEDSLWLYDTHTASLFLCEKEEVETLRLLRNIAGEKIHYKELVNYASDKLLQDLVSRDILLSGRREIEFGKPREAEIWIQSNHFCNLACPGCATGMDVKQYRQKKFDLVVLEKCLKRIIDDAKKKGFNHLQIKLGGGEPTLNGIEFLKGFGNLVRSLSEEHFSIRPVLLTNGIAITDEMAKMLAEGNIHASVSTDPTRRLGQGRIQALPFVLENIQRLKKIGASVSGQFTVGSSNFRLAADIYETLSDLEVPLHFSLFRPQTKEQIVYVQKNHVISGMMGVYSLMLKRIREQRYAGDTTSFDYLRVTGIKDGVCGAGKTYIILDSDGTVSSCHERIRVNEKKFNLLGNEGNVFNAIRSVHAVPEAHRYSQSVNGKAYPFMWQGGFGCPWVVEKLHGTYDASAEYVTEIYEEIAPIVLAMNVEIARRRRKGVKYG